MPPSASTPPLPDPGHPSDGDPSLRHTLRFRVRYSETDQMGTIYNSRPLEWFEMGRSELMRHVGLPYTEMEARGVFLPLIEAHVEYEGRARYDDFLEMVSVADMVGRARLRCRACVVHVEGGAPVARGHTLHVFTDAQGRPTRPPVWFLDLFRQVNV